MNEPIPHRSVMAGEVVEFLAPEPGHLIVDATLGAGGYASRLLQAVAGVSVIGVDRDSSALDMATERLSQFSGFRGLCGSFGSLDELLAELKIAAVDGLVADLGVSSMQLEEAARGFSFQRDGKLDMRMDVTQRKTAAEVVNFEQRDELARILFEYGEERYSRRIARAIVERRKRKRFSGTLELAEFVASVVPGGRGRIHPATKTFQALRIATNDELAELERLCALAKDIVRPGGVFVCVSFHSLEDRIVKRAHRERNDGPVWELLTKKPVFPSDEEVAANPRSRSARLRAARRLSS